MNYFLENAAPIWMLGAIGLTMAVIVYSSLRTTASLLAVVLVVLLTAAGLAIEHFWLTPREQVQQTLLDFLADVEADDLPSVLSRLAPGAVTVRSDAQTLMPQFQVEKARSTGSIEVSLDNENMPTSATVQARVFVEAAHRKSGLRGGKFSPVEFRFVRESDRWLLSDYSVSEDWRRGAAELSR